MQQHSTYLTIALLAFSLCMLPNLAMAAQKAVTQQTNNRAYDSEGNGSTPRAADVAASDIDTSTTHEAITKSEERNTKSAVDSSDPRVVAKGQKIESSNELGSNQHHTGKQKQ